MAKKRLGMRKITQILRLHHEMGLSQEKIALCQGVSRGAVIRTLKRFEKSDLSWPLAADMTPEELEKRLYGAKTVAKAGRPSRPVPDWLGLRHQLMNNKHLTRLQLWEEYRQDNPGGYEYSRFCRLFADYCNSLSLSYRNHYKGGECLQVDYSGDSMPIYLPGSDTPVKTEFFICTWGASNCTYWEFTKTQGTDDFLSSHERAARYFGCMAKEVIMDNAKVAVNKACRYEPEIAREYENLSEHYGFVVLPTPVSAPRDKGKEEAHVRFAQRVVLGGLRQRRFESLSALNTAGWELLERFNRKVMKKYGRSRRELFEELDAPNALALPAHLYGDTRWAEYLRAGIDYHVKVKGSYYSVPYPIRGKELRAKITKDTISIYHGLICVTSHVRSYETGSYSTKVEHMPESHKRYKEQNWQDLAQWAKQIGPQTKAVCEAIRSRTRHIKQAYRAVLGIVRLEKSVGKMRLETACELALQFEKASYSAVHRILSRGLDRQKVQKRARKPLPEHANIRGPKAFEVKKEDLI